MMVDLGDLGLGNRTVGILGAAQIHDVAALVKHNQRELLALRGFGPSSLSEVCAALARAGLELAEDPFAAYVCARHGDRSWDTNLANLFLCDDCAAEWMANAFGDEPPAYVGPATGGYCLNCNVNRADVALRQWFLCGTCERVARSIGRSVVSERFVGEQWDELIVPHSPMFALEATDAPTLRRRSRGDSKRKRAEIDFVARYEKDEPAFGFELKTGKSHVSGHAAVGAGMRQFQLDTSDCDDITTVMVREGIPVYLLHVQVIDRAHPPTVEYRAIAGWWTDPFRMNEHFNHVRRRPREAREAAYFSVSMFQPLATLAEHIENDGPARLAERIDNEGIPDLYWWN
jgi:hypothetical protein